MSISQLERQGTGMTSQRTRDRLAARLEERGIKNPAVLEAIRSVPRHLFVDEALSHRAYEDDALPIGSGQTISQPFIVARMTEAILKDGVPEKVLEVGTGSGYQAAILAAVVPKVFSVERVRTLLVGAKKLFRKLKLNNIIAKHGDGTWGWSESGPYDAIVVTAAPASVPEELLEQLSVGGCMVIPVGGSRSTQELLYIKRTKDGFEKERLEYVSFVPLRSGKA